MIQSLSIDLFNFFKDLGIWGAFLSMMIENMGIPLPTEIGYLIGQDLIQRQVHSYPLVLAILTIGHVLGSVISFMAGRVGDNFVIERLKRNGRVQETHDKLESWYQKYGNLTVFLTRFVGYVRPWSSFVAGFAGVKFWQFFLWTTLGSLIFNIICLYFSGVFILIWRKYAVYHVALISIMAILFFAVIIYQVFRFVLSFVRRRSGVEEK
ncbi:MAG TPA: DedA family protein [bacterium]|nr:DedA family protein [bacterium]